MLVISIIFLLLIVVFAVQNAQIVPITFMAWSTSLNLSLVVLGSASLGVIAGAVWSWFQGMSSRGRIKELQRQLDASLDKVSTLERAMNDLMNQRAASESNERSVQE